MNQPVHDYIVLGASLPGVVFAIRKSLAGHSVLLTDQYGFPGGSITQYLNCFQEAEESDLLGIARDIYQAVSPEMFERSLVNPESIKFSLQQVLENSSVELLFHVLPKKIEAAGNGSFGITLLAKEGATMIRGTKVVDASGASYGAALLHRRRTLRERSVNVFISRPADDNFLACEEITKAVKLSDGRYWLSLRHNTMDDLFAENETQTVIDAFGKVLECSGSRIQVLPLGAHAVYDVEKPSGPPTAFSTIDDLLGTSLGQSKDFVKASMIEAAHERI